MRPRNYPKLCGIAGIVLAEIYMLYTVLAPRATGEAVPWQHQVTTALTLSVFFGPFGALVGTGVGLLIGGLVKKSERGDK